MTSTASQSPAKAKKFPWMWVLRVLVSAVVLFVIFHVVPIDEVWAQARRLPPVVWIGALIAFLAGHAAAAVKWRLLIGPGPSFGEAFRAHLAGLAANLGLPGVAGGDVVRAGLVFRQAKDPSRLAVGSVADRLLDTLGLVIIAAVGAAFAMRFEANDPTQVLMLLVVVLLVLVGLFVGVLFASRHYKPSNAGGKVARVLAQAMGAATELAKQPGRLALCLLISMIVQAVFVIINIAFAVSSGVEAPAAAWFFAWSAAKIIAIAPVSLGGLGVREASMAALLAPFGAAPAQVVAVGLIWQTVLYASGVIGALVQLAWKPGRRQVAPASEVATERFQ
jgi:uncharacterized protein (TIRG00374 family)